MKKKRTLPRVRREDGPRPKFLPFAEACRYGGFGRQTAYDLIHAGRINAVKLGRRTIIEVASIDRLHATLPKLTA
jgi:excisionase family DNA binding protein